MKKFGIKLESNKDDNEIFGDSGSSDMANDDIGKFFHCSSLVFIKDEVEKRVRNMFFLVQSKLFMFSEFSKLSVTVYRYCLI